MYPIDRKSLRTARYRLADGKPRHSQGCAGTRRPGRCALRRSIALVPQDPVIFGTTAREILEVHAGGMKDGLKLKAWLPGGASTDFLTELELFAEDGEAAGSDRGDGSGGSGGGNGP